MVLADFGIARSCDDHYGLTRTGDVITTVAYASPELLQGWPLDARTDIYSLGCTLFHLLTGHAPFSDRPGLAAVMMAHIQHPAPRLSGRARKFVGGRIQAARGWIGLCWGSWLSSLVSRSFRSVVVNF
ncbi:protein kinase domain-containing protein, partial [Mycobacterium innocens]|uniref:protein kinase domain-containing protein n=1 Tax=Mycobacterium innocens TaxID=2341083 RepID=UPI0031345908